MLEITLLKPLFKLSVLAPSNLLVMNVKETSKGVPSIISTNGSRVGAEDIVGAREGADDGDCE